MKIRQVLKVLTGWLLIVALVLLYPIAPVWAFCGFYVAKADAQLYNQASQVAIARQDQNTIITMANDYQGSIQDFALVVPVPTVIDKEQVNVGDNKILERLDSFSAPRLVEYFDADPCQPVYKRKVFDAAPAPEPNGMARRERDRSLGVTVEKQFTVGEYVSILSVKASNGLQTWLQREGYRVPRSANSALQAYTRQRIKSYRPS